MSRVVRWWFRVLVCAIVTTTASCRRGDVKVDYVVRSGSFDQIDVKNERATFRFVPEGSDEPKTEVGRVDSNTEVIIDGRIAELADIRPGEPVSVDWRLEKRGDFRRVDALKIRIERGGDEGLR